MIDKDKKELNKLKLNSDNHKVFHYDISNLNTNKKMINEIFQWSKRIDVLVNNAGVANFGKIENINFNVWRKIMDTNLDGAFMTTQKLY